MKNITEISEKDFESVVLRSEIPVLVDFYAPWCGPCKILGPLLQQLAAEFEGRLRFVKIDVDDAGDLASFYGITGVPTLIAFQGGKPTGRTTGLIFPRQLREWLHQLTAEAVAPSRKEKAA